MNAFAGVLMALLGVATCFVSDLFVRDIPGANAASYDLAGTILIVAGFVGFLSAIWKEN